MPEPVTVGAAAIAVGTQAFSGLLSNLATKFLERTKDGSSSARERLKEFKADFKPHLEATFIRCTKVKTLVNPNVPVDLLSLYVNTRFPMNRRTYDDYDLIERIKGSVARYIITGTGGGGKTFFMK